MNDLIYAGRDRKIVKIMLVCTILLMILIIFAYTYSRVSVYKEIKNEPNSQVKINFCKEHNSKYYNDSCWVQLFQDRQAGGYKYPILVNSTGEMYLGEKERAFGGTFPHI